MSVPTKIADLSVTPASNSPAGSDSIGTSLDDYLRAIQAFERELFDTGIIYCATVGGTADVITLTPQVLATFTAYKAGQGVAWIASGANTTNVTVNVNSLGAKAVTKSGATALSAGDISSSALIIAIYDGTQFQISSNNIFSSLIISGDILDANNNELIDFNTTASAVNQIAITNSATASGPILSATGGDTNIDLNLQAKGTGVFNLKGTATAPAEMRFFENTGTGTNYTGLKAASSIAANKTFELPSADGTANQVLATNASAILSFIDVLRLSSATVAAAGSVAFAFGATTFIFKWGVKGSTLNGDTDYTWTFPAAFPGACFFAVAFPVKSAGPGAIGIKTTAGVTAASVVFRNGGVSADDVYHFAIGN